MSVSFHINFVCLLCAFTLMLLTNLPKQILYFQQRNCAECNGSLTKAQSLLRISHFRIHFSLCFMASLSTKSFSVFLFILKLELITRTKISCEDSLWKREWGVLGNVLQWFIPSFTMSLICVWWFPHIDSKIQIYFISKFLAHDNDFPAFWLVP